MLAELRSRSQITIPAEIIKNLGISEGDKFEVMEKDGGIFLCPVVIYPKEKLMALAQLLKKAEDVIRQEFAFSLGISPGEIGRYIQTRLGMETAAGA